MYSIKELADDRFRERVLRARGMPPEEKLLAGPRLFEEACREMKDRIRHQFPDADEACVDDDRNRRMVSTNGPMHVTGRMQANRIDWDYVNHWCDVHGTRALLDEIRASIPPI